jgi:ankyrin repeat protein
MAELKQGGKERNTSQPKPRLGDIFEYKGKLTRQLKSVKIGCVTNANWAEVKRLVSLGADPNAMIDRYMSLLMHAVSEGKVEMCRFLLEKGADADFQMKHNGQTALMFAACRIHGDTACAIFDMLFEHGADISLRDSNGKDAIMWVAETRKLVAGSYMNRTERNALHYLVEIMLGKAFMREFKECIKG